jgi:hypothetical protein
VQEMWWMMFDHAYERFDPLANEVRGDVNNFKGTDYHLLYTLWLLLTNNAVKTTFFAGNDLHTMASKVPSVCSINSLSAVAVIHPPTGDREVWAQIKCTQSPWTVSALMRENVLQTFLFNTIQSEAKGKGWNAALVTTSEIRTTELVEFAKEPDRFKKNRRQLEKILDSTGAKLAANGISPPARAELESRAREIIQQIASCSTIHRSVLKAEVRERLAISLVDLATVNRVFSQLYGALFHESLDDNGQPITYDSAWVQKTSGIALFSSSPLDVSVSDACKEQVQTQISNTFDAQRFVPRSTVSELLDAFAQSSQSVFVLKGKSGSGKTWTLANWCLRQSECLRLFVRANALGTNLQLANIVGTTLRPYTAQALSDFDIMRKVTAAASSRDHSLVLVLDDIRPSPEHPASYCDMISRIAAEARQCGIKLVFSCQTDFIENLAPFAGVDRRSFFPPFSEASSSTTSAAVEPAYPSIGDFSSRELRIALSRRVGDAAEAWALRLTDPVFSLLWNPQRFSGLFDSLPSDRRDDPRFLDNLSLSSILDRPLDALLDLISAQARISPAAARELWRVVMEVLWTDRTISRFALEHAVQTKLGVRALDSLNWAYRLGLLNENAPEHFADRRLWARSMARYVQASDVGLDDVFKKLRWETDHDLVEQMIAISHDRLRDAAKIVQLNERWTPAVADGLVYAEPDDLRVLALLLCLGRLDTTGNAAEALGRYALRSTRGWKWLVRRFIGGEVKDEMISGRALWCAGRFAPDQVFRAAKIGWFLATRSFHRNTSPTTDDEQNYRSDLGDTLRPLASIESESTIRRVFDFLDRKRGIVEYPLRWHSNTRLESVQNDPLLREFDSCRLQLLSKLDAEKLESNLEDILSPELLVRARVINSMEDLARTQPRPIRKHLLAGLRSEHHPSLLARVLWMSFRVFESDPPSTLQALSSAKERLWIDYEVAGASLCLCESVSRTHPIDVLQILPSEWSPSTLEFQALLSELYIVSWLRTSPHRGRERHLPACPAIFEATDGKYELYALRAKLAITLLSAADVDVQKNLMSYRTETRPRATDFFYLGLGAWITSQRDLTWLQGSERIVIDIIIAAAASESAHQPDVLDRWRANARYMLSRDCLRILVKILEGWPEPVEILKRLPRDWQALYVGRCLLDKSTPSPEFLDFLIAECESHERTATLNASHERNLALATLQTIAPERIRPLSAENWIVSSWFGGGEDTGTRLAAALDSSVNHPIETLETLASRISLISLKDCHAVATRPETLLISEPYQQMLVPRRLTDRDADLLIDTMQSGLSMLPQGPVLDEHIAIYQAIRTRWTSPDAIAVATRDDSNAISQSHVLASKILTLSNAGITRNSLLPFIQDRVGWREDFNCRWDERGRIRHGRGAGYYIAFQMPAVRLALFVVGSQIGWRDPGYEWASERRDAQNGASEAMLRYQRTDRGLEAAVERLRMIAERFPNQEFAHACLGELLLKMGDHTGALSSLNRAQSLPMCDGEFKGAVLYNLACHAALVGNSEDCRKYLNISAKHKPLDLQWIQEDNDLESVRSEEWFIELISQSSDLS